MYIAILAGLCGVSFFSDLAGQVSYGTFENPFSADSIWNLPIGSAAQYVHANIHAGTTGTLNGNINYIFINDEYNVMRLSASDPLVPVYNKIHLDHGTYCVSSSVDTSKIWFHLNLPPSYISNTHGTGNNIQIFVESNGRVRESYLFERCSQGEPAAMWNCNSVCAGAAWSDSY